MPLGKIREERIQTIKKKMPVEKMNIVATVVDGKSPFTNKLPENKSELRRLSSIQIIDA